MKGEKEEADLDRKVLDALERLGEAFQMLKRDIAREHGLTRLQVGVLTQLLSQSEERPSNSDLARKFGVTRATMGEVVQALWKKGFLEKEPNAKDRRSFGLCLSQEGFQLAEAITGHSVSLQESLEGMERPEKETLLRSSLRLIHRLIQEGVVNVQRICYTCRFYSQKDGRGHCELLDLVMDEPRIDCQIHETA